MFIITILTFRYNGRALFKSHITTSFFDSTQIDELRLNEFEFTDAVVTDAPSTASKKKKKPKPVETLQREWMTKKGLPVEEEEEKPHQIPSTNKLYSDVFYDESRSPSPLPYAYSPHPSSETSYDSYSYYDKEYGSFWREEKEYTRSSWNRRSDDSRSRSNSCHSDYSYDQSYGRRSRSRDRDRSLEYERSPSRDRDRSSDYSYYDRRSRSRNRSSNHVSGHSRHSKSRQESLSPKRKRRHYSSSSSATSRPYGRSSSQESLLRPERTYVRPKKHSRSKEDDPRRENEPIAETFQTISQYNYMGGEDSYPNYPSSQGYGYNTVSSRWDHYDEDDEEEDTKPCIVDVKQEEEEEDDKTAHISFSMGSCLALLRGELPQPKQPKKKETDNQKKIREESKKEEAKEIVEKSNKGKEDSLRNNESRAKKLEDKSKTANEQHEREDENRDKDKGDDDREGKGSSNRKRTKSKSSDKHSKRKKHKSKEKKRSRSPKRGGSVDKEKKDKNEDQEEMKNQKSSKETIQDKEVKERDGKRKLNDSDEVTQKIANEVSVKQPSDKQNKEKVQLEDIPKLVVKDHQEINEPIRRKRTSETDAQDTPQSKKPATKDSYKEQLSSTTTEKTVTPQCTTPQSLVPNQTTPPPSVVTIPTSVQNHPLPVMIPVYVPYSSMTPEYQQYVMNQCQQLALSGQYPIPPGTSWTYPVDPKQYTRSRSGTPVMDELPVEPVTSANVVTSTSPLPILSSTNAVNDYSVTTSTIYTNTNVPLPCLTNSDNSFSSPIPSTSIQLSNNEPITCQSSAQTSDTLETATDTIQTVAPDNPVDTTVSNTSISTQTIDQMTIDTNITVPQQTNEEYDPPSPLSGKVCLIGKCKFRIDNCETQFLLDIFPSIQSSNPGPEHKTNIILI